MAEFEEIDLLIDKTGKITVSVRGVPGELCLAATADLESALGNLIKKRTLTAEFYEEPRQAEIPVTARSRVQVSK